MKQEINCKCSADAENIDLDFILKPQENQLDDVKLFTMPVTVRAIPLFTTQASQMATKESWRCNDSRRWGKWWVKYKWKAKPLPGMVEGKDFFWRRQQTCYKNIPADAVDKVEVLKLQRSGPNARTRNDRDNAAINIKLKEGKKNFLLGVTAGGIGRWIRRGKWRYLVHQNFSITAQNTV